MCRLFLILVEQTGFEPAALLREDIDLANQIALNNSRDLSWNTNVINKNKQHR
jgi:hypothetical protein